MKVVLTVLFYGVALILFPFLWVKEQKSALRMAWFGSFYAAHIEVKKTWALSKRSARK